jgi:Flp pilus assembly protein TadB
MQGQGSRQSPVHRAGRPASAPVLCADGSRYTLSRVLRANRLLIWAALWVAFGIYWLTQGFWIFTIALLAAAGLLVWQARRDRRVSRPPLS